MNKPVRVFIVDDSALMRHRLSAIIQAAPGYQVVGQAGDGNACLTQLGEIRPDVVTLDVEMPGLDGLSTLRRIMQEQPTPVLMISSTTESGAKTTIDALARGAIDYLTKPDSFAPDTRAQFGAELIAKLDVVSRARMSAGARRAAPVRAYAPGRAALTHAGPTQGTPLVVIGSSTGGPQALDHIFDQLSAALGAAFLVVQHMAGFHALPGSAAGAAIDAAGTRGSGRRSPGRAYSAGGARWVAHDHRQRWYGAS